MGKKRKMIAGAVVVLKTYRNGPRYEIVNPDVRPEDMEKELGYVLRSRGLVVPTMKVRRMDNGSIEFVNKARFDTVLG